MAIAWSAALSVWLTGIAVGQNPASPWTQETSGIQVTVEPQHLGLAGVVRPGSWTPLLVTLDNRSPKVRRVRCQWILPDADGDQVQAQRVVTLTPQRTQRVWLYGVPAFNTSLAASNIDWRLLVHDEQTGQLLANQSLFVSTVVDPRDNLIGITSQLPLGLQRWSDAGPERDNFTQYERLRLLRGLDPTLFPDRWYGYSALEALIWTPDSADPGTPAISPESLRALRQWIQRGGHLVVVLPAIGDDRWTGSPLASVLPPMRMSIVRGAREPALVLGTPQELVALDIRRLEPVGDTTVIFEAGDAGPWVVAGQYGLGRVTVVGADLTDRRIVRMTPGTDLWKAIFGWRSNANDHEKRAARENTVRRITEHAVELSGFARPLIAMRDTFTGALMLAMVLFGLYWLTAGPLGFAVLKQRRMTQHAWVAFVAVVMLFSAVAWGGAVLLRPRHTKVAHYSTLTIDAKSQMSHVHSWLSLFVGEHGQVHVALDSPPLGDELPGEHHYQTLWSPGMPTEKFETGFLDPRRYQIDVASPHQAAMPFRATARQIEVDFYGKLNDKFEPPSIWRDAPPVWVLPQASNIEIKDGWPAGQVAHRLPGTLTEVTILFSPGGNREPWVWTAPPWAPDQVLEISRPTADRAHRLVVPARAGQAWGGYLGERIRVNKPLQRFLDDEERVPLQPAANEMILGSEMLTFYSMLPPPEWWVTDWRVPRVNYYRAAGRAMDLSHLVKLRRLIIIGYLKDSPLPLPLTVNGGNVTGTGWTMVRWVCPLPPESPKADQHDE